MINTKEKRKYLLIEKRDIQILNLIHDLEKLKLSPIEKFIILWTRTQLEKNWRKPLLQILKIMKKNSTKNSKERLKKIQEFANKSFLRL